MQSVPISSVGRDPTTDIDADNVSSVATPPIGHQNSSDDQEFVSKTIRSFLHHQTRARLIGLIRWKFTRNGLDSFKRHSEVKFKSLATPIVRLQTSIQA
jgi:hypothetical protein